MSLVYFLFFLYRNTPMDELFILDIRKAGLRAFIVNIILNSITIVYIVIAENSNIRPENLTTIIRNVRSNLFNYFSGIYFNITLFSKK